eukprot:1161825-Rhodomonas_salina.1
MSVHTMAQRQRARYPDVHGKAKEEHGVVLPVDIEVHSAFLVAACPMLASDIARQRHSGTTLGRSLMSSLIHVFAWDHHMLCRCASSWSIRKLGRKASGRPWQNGTGSDTDIAKSSPHRTKRHTAGRYCRTSLRGTLTRRAGISAANVNPTHLASLRMSLADTAWQIRIRKANAT